MFDSFCGIIRARFGIILNIIKRNWIKPLSEKLTLILITCWEGWAAPVMRLVKCLERSTSTRSTSMECIYAENNNFHSYISWNETGSTKVPACPPKKALLKWVPVYRFPCYSEEMHGHIWTACPSELIMKYPSLSGYNTKDPSLSDISSYFALDLSLYRAVERITSTAHVRVEVSSPTQDTLLV